LEFDASFAENALDCRLRSACKVGSSAVLIILSGDEEQVKSLKAAASGIKGKQERTPLKITADAGLGDLPFRWQDRELLVNPLYIGKPVLSGILRVACQKEEDTLAQARAILPYLVDPAALPDSQLKEIALGLQGRESKVAKDASQAFLPVGEFLKLLSHAYYPFLYQPSHHLHIHALP